MSENKLNSLTVDTASEIARLADAWRDARGDENEAARFGESRDKPESAEYIALRDRVRGLPDPEHVELVAVTLLGREDSASAAGFDQFFKLAKDEHRDATSEFGMIETFMPLGDYIRKGLGRLGYAE